MTHDAQGCSILHAQWQSDTLKPAVRRDSLVAGSLVDFTLSVAIVDTPAHFTILLANKDQNTGQVR